ncbi:hypothetical protein H6G89_13375 [Oscillatoria sp. FACHB-1407]|uniref:serine/threonine-protein kinase n=1 Tax=Oscillatoria sp. FACHB-1407 TaxID=2692847 RepID=UPI0016895599|nr:serine/threonine-protein kinase [Oscillatoria sp. FACHB-1407]MBD2462039.1 hypothetical protein [Oscillatoria sp. FACHB-1407]
MSLTAGTPLQNGKYVIQAVLEQSDFGTTYKATHVYLDQAVILQTLENKHSDLEKVTWFEQQFLAGVRRLNKGENPYPGRVLDYFTESQSPYVVLEYIPEHPLPKILDWLLTPSANDANGASEPVEDSRDSEPLTEGLSAGVPTIAQVTTALQQPNGAIANGSLTNAATPGTATNGATNGSLAPGSPTSPPNAATVVVARAGDKRSPALSTVVKRKTNPWLPASLMLTTVVAGLAGAGFGLTLRFNPPTTNSHPIFSNEQAFPPTEGWPIQEEMTESFAPSRWDRPAEQLNEDPVSDRYVAPPIDPVESFDPDKVTLPEETIPKTPTEFEGSEPLVPEELPLPEPAADTSLPPADPVYVPPASVEQPAPPPAIEPAPVAPAPAPQSPPAL